MNAIELDDYATILRERLLRLVKEGSELKHRPLSEKHAATGMYVFEVLALMADSAGITENELREALR